MAESNRVEILSTISKKDVEGLIGVTEKLHNAKTLQDAVMMFNKRQREELWDGVLSMGIASFLESNDDEVESPETVVKMKKILQCITQLADATLKSMKQTVKAVVEDDDEIDEDNADDQEQDIEIPASFHETIIILHGILPTLGSQLSVLKNSVSLLLENWWCLGLPGRDELMANTLLYLLERSTQPNAAKKDVQRVMALHKVFSGADLMQDNAEPLLNQLLKCSCHPNYVTTTQGIQFLAFLITLNPSVAQKLHESIKIHLPSVPVFWGTKYGEIYFRAWQKSSAEQKEYIELNCIQDLMHNACRIRMGPKGSVWHSLYKILSCLHGKKAQRGVADMLSKLYEPILWRSLKVCNSDVRLNAARLMFSVFPLQSSTLRGEEVDAALQRQFDVMHSLLQDPVPAVRLAAVEGVGRVLSIYWELIPQEVLKCFMSALIDDLAHDFTSPAVREAVIKTMQQLCGNHLAVPMLGHVLPSLGHLVHDVSERVRLATLDLLLNLKGMRAIKFYSVVPVDHLLARLEVETKAGAIRRVMKLLFRSFVPVHESPQQQLERCKALILSNPGAAQQFYLHLPDYLEVEDIVRYISLLCRYLVESARQLNKDSNDGADQGGTVQHTEEESPNVDSSTPRRSRRSGAKKTKSTSAQDQSDNDDDDDNGENNQQQHHQVATMLRGMMEAVYLMYITVARKLAANPDLRAMSEGIAKKLSVTVKEVMAVSQDPDLDSTLIALAGLLPSRALPLASQNFVNRLCRAEVNVDGTVATDITSVVKAVVQWGKANLLLGMVRESITEVLLPERRVDKGAGDLCDTEKENSKGKKKKVGFSATSSSQEQDSTLPWQVALNVLEIMLSCHECRPSLHQRHGSSLVSLASWLQDVAVTTLKLSLSPSPQNPTENDQPKPESQADVAMKLYQIHLRMFAFLCCRGNHDNQTVGNSEDKRGDDVSVVVAEASKGLVTALTWGTTCLLPWLRKAKQTSIEDHVQPEEASVSPPQNSTKTKSKGKRKTGQQYSTDKKSSSLNVSGSGMKLKRKQEDLGQLLSFTLRLTACVIQAGWARPDLLDEAIQLCITILRIPNDSNGETVACHGSHLQEPHMVASAVACVYQLLSLRPASVMATGKDTPQPGDASEEQSPSVDSKRYTEVACTFAGMLLESLTKWGSQSNQLTSASIPSGTSQMSDILKAVTPPMSELLLELITPLSKSTLTSSKTVTAVFLCVLQDVSQACEKDEELGLDSENEENVTLPFLAAAMVSVMKKRSSALKLFCGELEVQLSQSQDGVVNIHQARAFVVIVLAIQSVSPVLLSPSTFPNLRQVLVKADCPLGMDEDVYRDLVSQTENRIKKMKRDVINVN